MSVTAQFLSSFAPKVDWHNECERIGKRWLEQQGYKRPTPKPTSLPRELLPGKRRVIVDSEGNAIGPEIPGAPLLVPDEAWRAVCIGVGYQWAMFDLYNMGNLAGVDEACRDFLRRDCPEVYAQRATESPGGPSPLPEPADAGDADCKAQRGIPEPEIKVRLSRRKNLRMTREQYDALEEAASKAGKSPSAFARQLLKEGIDGFYAEIKG